MEIRLDEIIAFGIEMFLLYDIYRFMVIFFNHDTKDINLTVCAFILKYVASVILNTKYSYVIVNITVYCVTTFLITLTYNGKISKKILAVLYTYCCGVISEVIVALCIKLPNITLYSQTEGNNLLINFSIDVLLWLLTLVTGKFLNVKNDIRLPIKLVVSLAVVPFSTIMLVYIIFMQPDFDAQLRIISLLCIMAANFIVIYLFDSFSLFFKEKAHSELAKRERNYYYKQAQLLNSNQGELRKFRHDIKNHLLIINKLIAESEYGKVSSYMETITDKLNATNSYSSTENLVVDSIINYKLSEAAEKGINVTCNVKLPSNLTIEEIDIIAVLGNLLDNALEAAEKVSEKPFISLDIRYKKGYIFISVKNNYKNKLNMINGRMLTTKSDKTIHGIGLKSVKSVVEKYSGTIDFKNVDNSLEVNIMLVSG